MPAPFARLARAAGRTTDRVFGERFHLIPRQAPASAPGRRDVNARREAEPGAPPIPFTGVFVAPGALAHARGRAMADSTTHAIAAEQPRVDVAVDALAERPQAGWHVLRLDTGARFEITHCLPVDLGRLSLHLAEIR
ncbi:hypothetical protein [Methylobacterium sp. CCH5-D2]|uniref:hypothetical protein n=1 Tax=Methylobacterium sp. CCH5-D2 TaxID=1768765 RepID=UPI00082C1521|nr:hypothetical protein [Methylobacterium sp. CCH5-D2]